MPFLPIYIRQMGETDVGRIAVWTGVALGVTPAMTALLAPAWGRLADRYGRKFMVLRSLAGFVVLMAAMGFVTAPWHLVALRVVQGVFAGYGALSLAMAAESAPEGRMAQSIGLVQTSQRLGPALGPVIGAGVVGFVGLRNAFIVTAGFYLVAFVLMLVVYVEPKQRHLEVHVAGTPRVAFRNVVSFENFLLLMALIFGFTFIDRSLGPVLPLHLPAIGVADARVATASGVIFSALACAAAFGHHLQKLFAIQPVRSHPQRELTLARNMISPSHTAHQSSVLAIPEYHFLFISLIPLFALDSLVIALSAWVISDPTGCSD